MKHDLDGFSREIVRLIITSGDSGGSGDTMNKSLRHSGFSVPTRRAAMSPLPNDWDRESAATGDSKCKHLQAVTGCAPSVPTATTQFPIAQPMEARGNYPAEWHAILAGLKRRDLVDRASHEQWRGLLYDAENFLRRWGGAAHLLGWTSPDLFGNRPITLAAGVSDTGLIPTLRGAEVVALTRQSATFRSVSRRLQSYHRHRGVHAARPQGPEKARKVPTATCNDLMPPI